MLGTVWLLPENQQKDEAHRQRGAEPGGLLETQLLPDPASPAARILDVASESTELLSMVSLSRGVRHLALNGTSGWGVQT